MQLLHDCFCVCSTSANVLLHLRVNPALAQLFRWCSSGLIDLTFVIQPAFQLCSLPASSRSRRTPELSLHRTTENTSHFKRLCGSCGTSNRHPMTTRRYGIKRMIRVSSQLSFLLLFLLRSSALLCPLLPYHPDKAIMQIPSSSWEGCIGLHCRNLLPTVTLWLHPVTFQNMSPRSSRTHHIHRSLTYPHYP